MKVKRIYVAQPEGQADKINAVGDEWWRKAPEPECRIANPKLRQCWITVHLDQDSRFLSATLPRLRQTPQVLDDEYDAAVYKRRLERIHDYLEDPDARKQIVEAFESGARSLTLSMKEVPTFDDHTALSVRLGHEEVNGERHLRGVK